jgi:hypothetical protein
MVAANPLSQAEFDSYASNAHLLPVQRATFLDLIRAFELLNRRGPGVLGWAAPFRDDPLAFVLDSMSDALNLWKAGGKLLFSNTAALSLGLEWRDAKPFEQFSSKGRRFERRCIRYTADGGEYVLEIVRQIAR